MPPIHYAFSSGSRQHTRCTYVQQTRSTHTLVHFVASYLACTRGAGPHVYCLVREMEWNEEVLQACAAILVADALLETPKRRRKKLVNDYLLERTTKGSFGGLLTELSLEKEIFKEYLCIIRDTLYSVFLYTSEMVYSILQRYRVSKPAVVMQSISVRRDEGPHSILVHSNTATPNNLPPWLLVLHWGSRAARGDVQTRQIRAFFSGAASACNFE